MIYTLARDVEAFMRAKKWPHRVIYNADRERRAPVGNQIVIERDRGKGDRTDGAQKSRVNPKAYWVRRIGCVAWVYAKSELPGAALHDHERVADQSVDMLLVALAKWATEGRTFLEVDTGRLLTAQELHDAQIERWTGVVYMLPFSVGRGVTDLTYASEAEPEGVLEGFSNTTTVSIAGAAGSDTACGG